MIRNALLLCAALLTALCFACVQALPPPQPPPPVVGQTATCDPSPFLAKAFLLSPGFNPRLTGQNYTPPKSAGQVDPNGNIGKDLASAYCLADSTIRSQLLRLNAVFINQDSCLTSACSENSWGYRERPEQPPGNGRYIALSASLWPQPNAQAITYRTYENNRLNDLLAWPTTNSPTYPPPVAGTNPSDTPQMAVLAALAHEYGHVLWYDELKPNGRYNLRGFCDGNFFQFWASQHIPGTWRDFQSRGKRKGHMPDLHATGVQIKDIDTEIQNNQFDNASSDLSQLFNTDAPWASFLGAISIDEDFVETFTLDTLTQAALTQNPSFTLSLPIQFIDGTQANIAADYATGGKQDLGDKANCIADALPPSSAGNIRARVRLYR